MVRAGGPLRASGSQCAGEAFAHKQHPNLGALPMLRSRGVFAGARFRLFRCARRLSALTSCLLLLAAAGAGIAQQTTGESADSGASNSGGLQEVVVTARKREENVMRVPDTISVFSSKDIDNLRLNEISDFLALTPNVKIIEEQDSATNEIFIRGIGSNRNEASAVAFVEDGVILPDPDAFTTDLSDADHVEVLKGPQGALYGKGALAGVIVINTRQPTDQFEADTKLSYGTGDTFDAFAGVGGPLVGDVVLARVTIKDQQSNGYYTNEFNGRPIDPDNFIKPTLSVLIKPTDRLTLDVRGDYYVQDAGNPPYTLANLIGPPGTGTDGVINSEVAETPIAHNSPDRSWRKIYDSSLTASYDTGVGTVTSITAYDKINFHMEQDLDFTPVTTATAAQERDTRGTSEELRFTSPSNERFRYIAGVYTQYTTRFVNTDADIDACLLGLGGDCQVLPQIPSGILIPLHLAQNVNYDHQYAGFAQSNYDLTDDLELTTALRYDQDNRSQWDQLLTRTDAAKFDAWQPKVSLAYKYSADGMTYFTYAQGYKSGIFNTANSVVGDIPLVVRPEKTNGFEVGAKNSFFDRRLLLSAAAYYTKYDDAQEYHLDIQSGGQATVNVDQSRIYGLEVQAAARPLAGLDLNLNYGYNNSKIQNFNGTSAYVGQPLPSTPLYTLNVGAQYTYQLPQSSNVSGRVEFSQYGRTIYQDFQNPDTNEVLRQVPYNLVDAQIGYTHENWTLTVFGKNVFNEHYVLSAYSRYISALIFSVTGDPIHEAPGAIWGVEVRARF
jgi:iron complex outermembrane recepter protein